MTKKESNLLGKVIDLNWEFSKEKNPAKKWDLAMELNNKKNELRESMGYEAYQTFMNNGRKMFSKREE